MAIANNSEGSSVPPDMLQNLEMEDDYSKLEPSADYTSPPGRNIFRNKKFTKKRHEPKARKTQDGQDPSTVNCSEEDEEDPNMKPKSPSVPAELFHRSIPKMMMSINQTIKKMSIKDNGNGGGGGNGHGGATTVDYTAAVPSTSAACCGGTTVKGRKGEAPDLIAEIQRNKPDCLFSDGGARLLAELEKIDQEEIMERSEGRIDLEEEDEDVEHCHQAEEGATTGTVTEGGLQDTVCAEGGSGRTCSLSHPQGKRRRHRRKQQYKRMAVDVQSEKCLKLKKVPNSNSSEDSGIGKRKRNIILHDNIGPGNNTSTATADAIMKASSGGIVPVPVRASSSFGSGESYATISGSQYQYDQQWKLDQDSDAVMMDFDDMESSGNARMGKSRSHHITEEESGESDTQNDDVESLSDHNQDADDEESDYYNNDSSTTSLSESSFTILNPSKKFIPVHSREIRSGRRRLKNSFLSVENEELSKFLQTPTESILKMWPSSEKERQDFMNVASLYSLSYEECQGQGMEDQRMWIQFTKTSKTTTATTTQQQQRRNVEAIKAAAGGDRSSLNNLSEGSMALAPLYDILTQDSRCEAGENSDVCFDDWDGSGAGSNVGVGQNQLVNSKRIKKGC